MGTVHHEAMQESLEGCLEETPGYGALIKTTRDRLDSGFYPEHIVNAIFQSYNDRLSTLDIHCFIHVYKNIIRGRILKTIIPVGEDPYRDRSIARNQEVFDRLPDIFNTVVTCERGRSANDDGTIKWNRTISADQMVTDSISGDISRQIVDVKAGFAVLEIGSTEGSKTIQHLFSGSSLARWPYGSENILLMIPNCLLREKNMLGERIDDDG